METESQTVTPTNAFNFATSSTTTDLQTFGSSWIIGGAVSAGAGTFTNWNGSSGRTNTSYSAGTKSSGTYTPDILNGAFQHATNGGAHTLAPPSTNCEMMIEYTNNASAGAITTSGFTKVFNAFTTTNGHKFHCRIIKSQTYSSLEILALQ